MTTLTPARLGIFAAVEAAIALDTQYAATRKSLAKGLFALGNLDRGYRGHAVRLLDKLDELPLELVSSDKDSVSALAELRKEIRGAVLEIIQSAESTRRDQLFELLNRL